MSDLGQKEYFSGSKNYKGNENKHEVKGDDMLVNMKKTMRAFLEMGLKDFESNFEIINNNKTNLNVDLPMHKWAHYDSQRK